MTLREWTLDPDTLALVGPDDIVTEAGTLCILGRMVGRAPRRIPSNTVVLRSSAVGIGI